MPVLIKPGSAGVLQNLQQHNHGGGGGGVRGGGRGGGKGGGNVLAMSWAWQAGRRRARGGRAMAWGARV